MRGSWRRARSLQVLGQVEGPASHRAHCHPSPRFGRGLEGSAWPRGGLQGTSLWNPAPKLPPPPLPAPQGRGAPGTWQPGGRPLCGARGFHRGRRRGGAGQRRPPSPHSARPRAPRMASPAGSGFPARTNSRLDAFLRRHLAPEVYDAIRAYEPCIVVSDSEKHTLKYLVLSDRLIYLTENPPKSIRQVVALRDVVAIDLVRSWGGGGGDGRVPENPFLALLPRRSTL